MCVCVQEAGLGSAGPAVDPAGPDLPGQLLAQQLRPTPGGLPGAPGPPLLPHLTPPGGGRQGRARPSHHHTQVLSL